MKTFISISFAVAVFGALGAPGAEARRSYHHHASFFSHHSHYHAHSHASHHAAHRSFAHHVAAYAVDYGVHYEIRKGVRAVLDPAHGSHAHEAAAPHDFRAGEPAGASAPSLAPPHPAPDATAGGAIAGASVAPIEYAHAGPRLGIKFYPNEMRIFSVDAGSIAYIAGLEPNDVVKKAGGARVRSSSEFVDGINASAPTGNLRLVVERAGKEYNASIPLAQPGATDAANAAAAR